MTGRTVFVHGIISHIIFRSLEQIKLDLCVRAASNYYRCRYRFNLWPRWTYSSWTGRHWNKCLPNMTILNPSDAYSADHAVKQAYKSQSPCYIRMDKALLPHLYDSNNNLSQNIFSWRDKRRLYYNLRSYSLVCIISSITLIQKKYSL